MVTNTRRIHRKRRFNKSMRGGQSGTANLPKGGIYGKNIKAARNFYEMPNPLLMSPKRKPKSAPSSAARKHVMETLAKLKKKTPPKN